MGDKINDHGIVKIYSNTDKHMKELGQILATTKSCKIYTLLIEKEMSLKELGRKLDNADNPRLPSIVFHLNKMVNVGLVEKYTRKSKKGGHESAYYRAIPIIVIVPPEYLKKLSQNKVLKFIFDNY